MTNTRYHTPATVALLVLWMCIGCANNELDITLPATPPVLTKVLVSVASTSVEVGQVQTASAIGLDQRSSAIGTGPVVLSSSNPEVAGVSPTTGFFLAIAPGTAQITATIGAKSGSKTITVSKAPGIRINEVQPHRG